MLVPVILSGGSGSRLWPVSRETHPKPFMKLADGESLLQKAFLRGTAVAEGGELLTVTNRELFFKTEDDYRAVNTTGINTRFVLEPFGRNTAAAVAAAALVLEKAHGPDVTLLILTADHLVQALDQFAQAVRRAQVLAQQGYLVTFGIQPTAPETGYGYIEYHEESVLRFVEKPNAELAAQYLQSGRFLWNSGMFCFTAQTLLQEMRQHCTPLLAAVEACVAGSFETTGPGFAQLELHKELFAKVPEDSIDYAVMEKSDRLKVVPCNIGWSDIGSWSAVSELTAPDAQGNRLQGQAMLEDAENCFVISPSRLVGLVGVRDLVVVDTPDALLVADRNRSQDVKKIYSKLKAQGHDTHKLHRTVHRPWGTYTVLEEGHHFKIKRIEVKPGHKLSLQMHHHRSEHWIVVSGTAVVVNGEQEIMLRPNESTYIPAGHQHRLVNPGVIDLVMIEVQSGQYLGEDDIVRFSDQYGRA